ncbi:MAG: DNA adenine methylase [Alphaproteobacteria bacterium]
MTTELSTNLSTETPYQLSGQPLITEGIKYTGSKKKLLPQILSLVAQINPNSIFDGFSGTTRVSQAFAQSGYQVIANDISIWSEIFANCYLLNKQPASYYQKMIDELNHLKPMAGWFSEHYGGLPSAIKKPWQKHNTMKLDAIRQEIANWQLNKIEESVLLTSLIHAMDAVDSTIGHYASYLHHWSKRSYKTMKMKMPHLHFYKKNHIVQRQDIFSAIKEATVDLAYFDPPYGSNNEKMPPSRVRYAAYYHLWKTIILNDRPHVFGKSSRRYDSSDTIAASVFEEFRKDDGGHFIAVNAIKKLLCDTRAKYILLSYSSGGRATIDELYDAMATAGKLKKIVEIDYRKNVMADMTWSQKWITNTATPHKEFLFLIEK